MSHMVIYRGADGKPGYQQVDDLSSAVAFVEKLRNDQAVENSRIYRLEQVNYRFETYFQVRLDESRDSTSAFAPTSSAPVGSAPSVAPPVALVAAAPVTAPPAAPAGPVGPPKAPEPPSAPRVAVAPTPAAAQSSAASHASAPSEAIDERVGEAAEAGNGIRRGLFGR